MINMKQEKATSKQQIKTAIVPLKDAYNKGKYTIRAKKSIALIRKYASRHAKADVKNIKIGVELNEFIWKHGIKNPPRTIKIQMYKKEKVVIANLTNIDIEGQVKQREDKTKLKKEEQKKEAQKQEEEQKKEETKEAPAAEPKDEKTGKKEEIKETTTPVEKTKNSKAKKTPETKKEEKPKETKKEEQPEEKKS
ncbi:MAG: 60S ribosomal protein L31 [Candidatus Aenigmarchaeota archaeon]|nr:60S ribosomal protein L31 [Candidatus Aenigmarchaeota archaeon]